MSFDFPLAWKTRADSAVVSKPAKRPSVIQLARRYFLHGRPLEVKPREANPSHFLAFAVLFLLALSKKQSTRKTWASWFSFYLFADEEIKLTWGGVWLGVTGTTGGLWRGGFWLVAGVWDSFNDFWLFDLDLDVDLKNNLHLHFRERTRLALSSLSCSGKEASNGTVLESDDCSRTLWNENLLSDSLMEVSWGKEPKQQRKREDLGLDSWDLAIEKERD